MFELACVQRTPDLPDGTTQDTKNKCLAVSELDNLIPPGNLCRFRYRGLTVRVLQGHNER